MPRIQIAWGFPFANHFSGVLHRTTELPWRFCEALTHVCLVGFKDAPALIRLRRAMGPLGSNRGATFLTPPALSPPSATSRWSCQGAIARPPCRSSVFLTAPSAPLRLLASQTVASAPRWFDSGFSAKSGERDIAVIYYQTNLKNRLQKEFYNHTTKASNLWQ